MPSGQFHLRTPPPLVSDRGEQGGGVLIRGGVLTWKMAPKNFRLRRYIGYYTLFILYRDLIYYNYDVLCKYRAPQAKIFTFLHSANAFFNRESMISLMIF